MFEKRLEKVPGVNVPNRGLKRSVWLSEPYRACSCFRNQKADFGYPLSLVTDFEGEHASACSLVPMFEMIVRCRMIGDAQTIGDASTIGAASIVTYRQ